MKKLTPAQRAMFRRLQRDPKYRPKRKGTQARFQGLIDAGLIRLGADGRVRFLNPDLQGLGRIIVVADEGEPEALYVGYTTAAEPRDALGALARGNVRRLSLVASWRAEKAEYDRFTHAIRGRRVRGCWFQAAAVRKRIP